MHDCASLRLLLAISMAATVSSVGAQVVGPRGPNNPRSESAASPSHAADERIVFDAFSAGNQGAGVQTGVGSTTQSAAQTVAAPVTAVTVYFGRAAVTRSATLALSQGVHTLRFDDLPVAAQPETLQARVGDPGRIVNVEFIETPSDALTGSPAMLALDSELESARRSLERLREDRTQILSQTKLVEQIGVRSAGDATRDAGSERLNLESLRKQLDFVQGERLRLLNADREIADRMQTQERALAALEARRAALGGGERTRRSAEVTVAMPAAGELPVTLTYLVTQAGWEAAYSVRAAGDRSGVTLEFDATLLQRSGEDWNDVALTIATAQPTMRANPPTISPVFVSVFVPPPAVPMSSVSGSAPEAPPRAKALESAPRDRADLADGGVDQDAERQRAADAIYAWSAGASVVEGGTAVSYELPRRVTVPSNADRRTRTRVATITPTATFVYTAVPLLTDAVYLRGRLVNDSPYQLVPGPVQVFVGSEFVGPTRLGTVPPKGDFTVFFGVDRSIRALRTLVAKNTTESGVFSKTRETTREYRIVIDNGSGRAIDLELFDRRPVSQDEKITVALDGPSVPLSTDPEYLRDQASQGIMRWDLSVPANSTGANAMAVTWTTKVSAARDVRLTPVPD